MSYDPYRSSTQTVSSEARAVDLPESHSQIELPDKDVINITVTALDSIYVDQSSIVDTLTRRAGTFISLYAAGFDIQDS